MHGGNISLLYLNRERIDLMLENIFHNSVTLITAPVGFGKSTSLQHFLSQKKDIFSKSFTFREKENDDVWFWNRFNEMVISSNPELRPLLEQLSFPQSESEILHYLNVIRELVKKESVCIIDDYHECDSPILNRVLEAMAYARIPLLHLVVIGRTFPSIPYEELALKASCLIIDQQDLLFTRDETAALATLNHITLSAQQLNWCLEYSGGWGSAICLVLNEYRQTGHMTHSMSIRELIRSSILDKLSPQEKDLLEQLAVIKSFLPEQAAYLTDEPAAGDILMRIASQYGFITVRDDQVIEISTLLQEAAVASYIHSGHNREAVFLKNAQWYESLQDLIPAIRNYAAGNSYDDIVRLLNRQDAINMITSSPVLFIDIFKTMPLQKRQTLHCMFDIPEVMTIFHHTPGQYEKTLHFISQSIGQTLASTQGIHLGWPELLNAEFCYQTGDIRKATELSRNAYTLSSWKSENEISISAFLILAKCMIYNGQASQILRIIPKPDTLPSDQPGNSLLLDYQLAASCLMALIDGAIGAPEWIAHFEIPEAAALCLESGAFEKAMGLYCIQTHQYDQLHFIAERMLEKSELGTFIFRQIHGHIFQSLCLWNEADQNGAVKQMQAAVDLAMPDRICMTFAEYGSRIIPILQLIRKTAFSADLIARCEQYGREVVNVLPAESLITLSDREKEILELVADGKTNVQISENLHLARITIEKNLSALYKKLGVSNRAAAIMKYQEIKPLL
ncbi:MAG: LuxR C-terminal-related transcriptional regulator [Butyrivibrio sp.]|jgi:ATP/maltotriose-dependent transcriptional regulator MalT|nr:LuxR C-terminal-related transcriptional regulator [Butyrivibrio sp.]